MTLRIQKIAGALGAEISGVDLSEDLSDDLVAGIRAALGPLNIHPYVRGMEAHPEVMEIIKEPADRTNFGGGWHSDTSFLERPAIGSILYALELPEWGGDTLFSSQVAAYDALSPGMKATLDGLKAVHSAGREYSAQGHSAQKRSSMSVAEAEGAVGEYVHPVVLVHPESGRKALYVNPAFTMRFEGWTKRESRPLLDFLFDHCRYEGFTCRFTWRPGSVAFWDNRQVWHFALNDYPGQRRHMRRVTVDPA